MGRLTDRYDSQLEFTTPVIYICHLMPINIHLSGIVKSPRVVGASCQVEPVCHDNAGFLGIADDHNGNPNVLFERTLADEDPHQTFIFRGSIGIRDFEREIHVVRNVDT